MSQEIDEEILEELYSWIDGIPLSRPKKDVRRDFSDGVLAAEVIKHYLPRLIELHNYPPATSTPNKVTNWKLMNWKVFRKLGFELDDDVIRKIANCSPNAVEQVLMLVRRKVDRYLYESKRNKGQVTAAPEPLASDRPEADQQQQQYQKPQGVQQSPSKPPTVTINVPQEPSPPKHRHSLNMIVNKSFKGELVPKIQVEEKEQELLTKDETIQILQAKVRRLEHLLHLKDIRVDDLSTKINNLEHQMRPTMMKPAAGRGATNKQR